MSKVHQSFARHSYLIIYLWDFYRLVSFPLVVILCNLCNHCFLPNGRTKVFDYMSVWWRNITVDTRWIILEILQLNIKKATRKLVKWKKLVFLNSSFFVTKFNILLWDPLGVWQSNNYWNAAITFPFTTLHRTVLDNGQIFLSNVNFRGSILLNHRPCGRKLKCPLNYSCMIAYNWRARYISVLTLIFNLSNEGEGINCFSSLLICKVFFFSEGGVGFTSNESSFSSIEYFSFPSSFS